MKRILTGIFIIIVVTLMIGSCATSRSRYNTAYEYYIRNDMDSALEILSLINENDPGFYPSHLLKAEILIRKGNVDEAEKALHEAKKIIPGNYMIPFNLGNIYFQKKDYQRAITEYSDSIKINSKFNKAYLNRGNTYMMIKSYRNALSDYERFLSLTPEGYDNVRKLSKILKKDIEAISR